MSKHLRILSINGGGVRGLIPAYILDYLSKISAGKQITELFDFIIGTSIGGILAGAYVVPKSLTTNDKKAVKFNSSEVLSLIRDNANNIFPYNQKSSGLFEPKYSREPLDNLLASLSEVDGSYLRLNNTLLPIALIAENAVTVQPQIWFSCGPQYSKYFLKDAGGATSAAPTYFLPKYTLSQEEVVQSCENMGLVDIHGECYHKSRDGGLFANNPAILTMYLWKNIVINNEVTNDCGSKYSLNVSNRLTLELAKNAAPQLYFDQDTNITVVSLGTGYASYDHEVLDIFSTAESISLAFIILPTIISFVAIVTLISAIPIIYTKLGYSEINNDASRCANIGHSILMDHLGVKATIAIFTGLTAVFSGIAYNFIHKAINAEEGKIAAITHNLISEILVANQEADLLTDRDVFGSITIDPVLNQSIELDNIASIPKLEQITDNFINQSNLAFNNLSICLMNSQDKMPECTYAAQYFYDALRNESKSVDPLIAHTNPVGQTTSNIN